MKKYICEDVDKNGNPISGSGCGVINKIMFNGYPFGDRMLENVMFEAFIDDNNNISVQTANDWNNDPYCKGLNKDYWLGLATEYAQDLDIATCPKCAQDIDGQPK